MEEATDSESYLLKESEKLSSKVKTVEHFELNDSRKASESIIANNGVEHQEPPAIEELTENAIEEKLLNNVEIESDSESNLDEAALLEEAKPDPVDPMITDNTEKLSDNVTPESMFADHVSDTHQCTSALETQVEYSEVPQRTDYEQEYLKTMTICEIGRCSWDKATKQNYVRGCLWSPDGTCVLAAVNNDGMHVFELPSDMYSSQQISTERPVQLLDAPVHVRESTLVYDYKWYPGMNSSMPETSVWIASRQHEPIQMWDAYTGKIRCSYKGYNSVDEVEAALSLAWSLDGGSIYGGYKKSIKVFDVKTPGREISSFSTKVTASCMTVCSPLPNLLIFGSWSRSITALVTNTNQTIPVGNNSQECSHNAGVTLLTFIPRTNLFVSGGRKDRKLMMWDIRKLTQPYHVLDRICDTNQRIYFDSSPFGEWLITGNTDGTVRAWNLLQIETASRSYRQYNFPLHRDCCNGVSFHPSKPIVATASGQFHFASPERAEEALGLDDSAADNMVGLQKSKDQENSLTLWWIGALDSSEQ
ncbi:telomerase Cajal body protein 1 homolog [Malaya genurostris]|uniref:telomerase Cajal body protein 1 homolog n=1 Tax=Malaya genurostris TaxID=325434 RepID=UPI0026F3805B|nr:telomerase Cajal body protein 1 homolog [Malaya genurostris]XP_058454882.1 telomerase Cajal body protein 1 homolog [Malaya genurostris]XP_058454883.1 telomerase Cajal body protein 1 homolog [Malaya genurostris]